MDLFNFLNHFIPLLITLVAVVVAIAMIVGMPYCRYVAFVSQADTDKGKEELAKYLAQKTGGRKINVDQTWRSFLPAAHDLHKTHLERRNQLMG